MTAAALQRPSTQTARARILQATVLVVAERGFAGTKVSEVCTRAGTTRGTFYELFPGLQECFMAMMDDAYRHVRELIDEAFAAREDWREGISAALVSLLCFLDARPRLSRVWFVETLGAGAWALERRERRVGELTRTIVERWPTPPGWQPGPVAATGVMESVLGMIRTHLLVSPGEPMIALLGPMMGLIATIYLGPEAVLREIERCEALVYELRREHAGGQEPTEASSAHAAVAVPRALRHGRAHRARRCLLYLVEHPHASNREIAAPAGIVRDDQISTTLARLAGLGLLVKSKSRRGGPNAWSLSSYGERVALAFRDPGMEGEGVGVGLSTPEEATVA